MYLINLKIQEGANSQEIIRDVPFNPIGLNIVVDKTLNGKGNNVGKTTFLRVIDICLGAKDRKYIWTDFDTESENKLLMEYIHDYKVFAELVVSNGKHNYTLKRDLFSRGTQYINGEKINIEKYRTKLNDIFFNHSGPPNFRQLISKFVRIKQTDDSYGTLKFLHTTTSFNEYRNVYEFLYKLSNPEISSKKLKLKNDIKADEQLAKDLFKAHSIRSKDELLEKIRLISNELSEQETAINKYISQSHYKDSVEKITEVKDTINILNDHLLKLDFKHKKIEEILMNYTESKHEVDSSLLKEFYKDVKLNIENVNVKFDELIKFNEQIQLNKSKYYTDELNKVKRTINKIKTQRQIIIDNNSDILNLLDDDNYVKYKVIHEKILKNKESLGELNEIKKAYTNVTKSLKVNTDLLIEIEKEDDNKRYLEEFNNFFSSLSDNVIGQRLFLIPNKNGFPLSLSNIDDGVGTGHRKTITLLIDISYVYLLNKFKIDHPYFFIHDVLESLDEHNMRSIVNAIEDVEAQFIFAILSEKIKNYDFINEHDIILELSEDDKLFRK